MVRPTDARPPGTTVPDWRIPFPRLPVGDPRTPSFATPGRPVPLTDRDRDLVRQLAQNRSVAQIAAAMSVSRNTARTRIHRLSGKLAVAGRSDVVDAARARGLV
jgi:DNA-binding CsgD family transcriptional regulator